MQSRNAQLCIMQRKSGKEIRVFMDYLRIDDRLIHGQIVTAWCGHLKINEIIAEETGTALDKVSKDTDRDYWLNAQESIEYGLISKIITERSDLN